MALATLIDLGNQGAANSITAASGVLAANAVGSNVLASNAVGANALASNAVGSNALASNAVTANALAAGAVTAGALGANIVTGAKVSTAMAIFNDNISTALTGTNSIFKLSTQAVHANSVSLYYNGQKLRVATNSSFTAGTPAAPPAGYDAWFESTTAPNTACLSFNTGSATLITAAYIATT